MGLELKDYSVATSEFSEFMRLRDRLPKSGFIWDMSADMAAVLEKPLTKNYPEGKQPRKKWQRGCPSAKSAIESNLTRKVQT